MSLQAGRDSILDYREQANALIKREIATTLGIHAQAGARGCEKCCRWHQDGTLTIRALET